jgi:putative colanic acid biosynthesis acetyltransferase WcaF
MSKVQLKLYDSKSYKPGGIVKRIAWHSLSILFFKTSLPFPSSFKVNLLKLFGAFIGTNVTIKPNINIKYPWFLIIGNNTWLGEGVWIDNLTLVSIGSNVCLSQGCYLLTGSHNYKSVKFDLILNKIVLEDGVWIGAKSIVCPGVTCKSHSILAVGSVATKGMSEYGVYQGNPAAFKRQRVLF